jgi:uncharacterized protein (TIGR02271 family)
MASINHPVVVGVFHDHTQAARAIDELHSAGFLDEKLRMKKTATVSGLLDRPRSNAIGYATENMPLPDELMDKGLSQNEAHYYQQEFEAGHSIVVVEAYEHQQEARSILQRYGAYGISTYIEQTESERSIPVREEVLEARKQWVQIGEVVLRKEVVIEQKTITVPIRREKLIVERLSPSAQPVQKEETIDEALKDGGTLKIVLHEEQVRIEKYSVVKEEIIVSKKQIEESKQFSDTVKREVVHIEQVGNAHIQGNNGNPLPD